VAWKYWSNSPSPGL